MRLVPLKTREGITGVIVMDGETEAVAPNESVTVAMNEKAPAVEGVPVMQPVKGPSERPGGKAPEVIAKE